jgi:hypothetical protein
VPKLPASVGEIAADLLVLEHMQFLGRLAQLFDRDRVEIGEKGFAGPAYGVVKVTAGRPRMSGHAVAQAAIRRRLGGESAPLG